MKLLNNRKIVVVFCLTLGLAPFFPEPHIWGKVNWIVGGASGMEPVDWFDVAIHGLPWLLLVRLIIVQVMVYFKV